MAKVLQVITGCKGLSSVNIRYIYKVVLEYTVIVCVNK